MNRLNKGNQRCQAKDTDAHSVQLEVAQTDKPHD